MAERTYIENRTFDEIEMGDEASLQRRLDESDIQLFALVSGDVNPAHVDSEFAAQDGFHEVIAHGMWGGGLISAVLGTELPGPGAIYLSQSLRFIRPVRLGDSITASVKVIRKEESGHRLTFDCRCSNQNGEDVILGEAVVKASNEKVRRRRMALPDVRIADHDRYRQLIEWAAEQPPVPTAVVHPCSVAALTAAIEAAAEGLIAPILVGPRARIEKLADELGIDLTDISIVDALHSHAAAETAVRMVASGDAQLLMKGSLHTDELMAAVLAQTSGLRTERRISHAYIMDVPGHDAPLIITDGAINIQPSLTEKADIIRNAIDLAHVIGIEQPRVALLSAVETVNPAIPATMDAAALCKMAERGQIAGGLVDGPLAFDNAIDPEAAREKGIQSPVAGRADILVAPNLDAGNILAKQLTFLGGADAAGIVLGARVPIILTSRADTVRTRLASCAVAVLLAGAATKAAPGLAGDGRQ